MVIKRNSRNIGKIVKVVIREENLPTQQGRLLNGRIGKIMGFRGDCGKGDPFVNVFIYDRNGRTGSVYPIAGHLLEIVGQFNQLQKEG